MPLPATQHATRPAGGGSVSALRHLPGVNVLPRHRDPGPGEVESHALSEFQESAVQFSG